MRVLTGPRLCRKPSFATQADRPASVSKTDGSQPLGSAARYRPCGPRGHRTTRPTSTPRSRLGVPRRPAGARQLPACSCGRAMCWSSGSPTPRPNLAHLVTTVQPPSRNDPRMPVDRVDAGCLQGAALQVRTSRREGCRRVARSRGRGQQSVTCYPGALRCPGQDDLFPKCYFHRSRSGAFTSRKSSGEGSAQCPEAGTRRTKPLATRTPRGPKRGR